MKNMKLMKTLLVAGVALSVGTVSIVGATAVSAKTVISESRYEKVISFTKADLEKATGIKLETTSINKVYHSLKQNQTWEALGYSASDAKKVADRFAKSYYQAIGILTDIAHQPNVSLKVIIVNKPYYSNVNIGTIGESTAPETGESSTEESESTEESTEHNNNESNQSALSKQVKEIEVEIEYKHDDIEFEYDVKSDGRVKAEFENEFTNQKIKGAKAQQMIEEIFTGLDVKNSSKVEIKNHVIHKIGASNNFKKFDFKVKFADKSKVDFKIK